MLFVVRPFIYYIALLVQTALTIPFLDYHRSDSCLPQPPVFFLAGDSTTAIQSSDGGGWGIGFLSTLENPAWGFDYGQNGATTVSFVDGGNWSDVISSVQNSSEDYSIFVTIQVGTLERLSRATVEDEAGNKGLY